MRFRIMFFLLALSFLSVPFTVESKTVSKKTKKEITKEPEVYSGIFDNVELNLSTSGEIYFFNILSLVGDDDELDYSSAQYKMKYDFEPVYMVSFQGSAKWNSLKLDAGYKTNRFFSQTGSVDRDGDPASELTTNKVVSRIIDIGIGFFDLNTTFRSVQFDCGSADVFTANTDDLVTSGQIKMNITDIDIFYDFNPMKKNDQLTVSVGYKYMEYSLPRIIYYFRDTNEGEIDNWVYMSETEPQEIKTRSHMGGFMVKMGGEVYSRVSMILDVGLYLGGGRMEFDINGSRENPFMVTMILNGKGGFYADFGESDTRCRISTVYEFNMIYNDMWEEDKTRNGEFSETRKKYTAGSREYYHGILLSASVTF